MQMQFGIIYTELNRMNTVIERKSRILQFYLLLREFHLYSAHTRQRVKLRKEKRKKKKEREEKKLEHKRQKERRKEENHEERGQWKGTEARETIWLHEPAARSQKTTEESSCSVASHAPRAATNCDR